MGRKPSSMDEQSAEANRENELAGAALNGAGRTEAVDHSEQRGERNPDTQLHLDDEKDTLYSDRIEVEEDLDTWAGTDGSMGRIP